MKLATEVHELKIALKLPDDGYLPNQEPNWNLCPTHPIAMVRLDDAGRRQLQFAHWGLVPSWAKEFKMMGATFNAKLETVAEKPTFRGAWKAKRRCLVVCDGWYEWTADEAHQPYYMQMPARPGRQPLTVMAGLYEGWTDATSGERRASCTVITTTPNAALAALPHDRMPILLDEEHWGAWLGETTADDDRIRGLLVPYAGELEMWTVSRDVGSIKNNGAHLAEPAPPTPEPPKAKRLRKPVAQPKLL